MKKKHIMSFTSRYEPTCKTKRLNILYFYPPYTNIHWYCNKTLEKCQKRNVKKEKKPINVWNTSET